MAQVIFLCGKVNHRKRHASKSAPASEGSLEICRQHDQCGPFRTKLPNIFARFRRYHAEVGLHLIVGNAKDAGRSDRHASASFVAS